MFVNWSIFQNIQKSYFGENSLLFTVNVWIKKSQMDEYPKYYWEQLLIILF